MGKVVFNFWILLASLLETMPDVAQLSGELGSSVLGKFGWMLLCGNCRLA